MRPLLVLSCAPTYDRTPSAPTTKGFSENRRSSKASGTTIGVSCSIACEQNEIDLCVCSIEIPCRDLNHCRSRSTKDIKAIGACSAALASRVTRSKHSSGGVSRISADRSALRRSSSCGTLLIPVTLINLYGAAEVRDGMAKLESTSRQNSRAGARIACAKPRIPSRAWRPNASGSTSANRHFRTNRRHFPLLSTRWFGTVADIGGA